MYRLIISSHLILGCYMCFTRIIDLSEFKGKGCSMEEEEVNKPPGTFTTHRHINKKEVYTHVTLLHATSSFMNNTLLEWTFLPFFFVFLMI